MKPLCFRARRLPLLLGLGLTLALSLIPVSAANAQCVAGAIGVEDDADLGERTGLWIEQGATCSEARTRAYQLCTIYARGCRVQLEAYMGCIARAIARRGGWGHASGSNHLEVQARASENCRRAGNYDCRPSYQ